jgi:Spy/CpxP family protein refolding chaperone
MTLKKILPILFILISVQVYSQGFREKKEQLKAMKIAFITDKLNLTPDEATKFWPIFNEFEAKQEQIRRQKMKSFIDRMDEDYLDKMNEKDASALLSQMESTEEEQHQMRKKFVVSLKNILPSIKIIKLIKAEEEFKKTLLRQYKERRKE